MVGCAVALALLLQPLLCVAHCFFHAQLAEHHADGTGSFLCHAAPAPDGATPLVPAFWPGVLPALLLLVVAATARRLSLFALPRLDAQPWAPAPPPPRTSIA